MQNQDKLIREIRNRVPDGVSVIDELAAVLEISYDAAHRRISMKSKFTIEEAVRLCAHYKLSMDNLFGQPGKVIAEKTAEIRSLNDMEAYLKQSVHNISPFTALPGAQMYYSAKDIPLFYTIGGTMLSKFKLYVWLMLLSGNSNPGSFEGFAVTGAMQQYGEALRAVYSALEVHELWNDTTINSTLQQIYYFYRAGLLNLSNVLLLLADLEKLLQTVEEKCSDNTGRYHLYYNELLILNNNVLITAPQQHALFVPYTMLGYFITADDETCTHAATFFKQQLKNSMALNTSGTRDRKMFFNRAIQKIAHYRQRMQGDPDFF